MNLLDLCSGVGMLGLAVEMLLAELGHAVRPVAYCGVCASWKPWGGLWQV